MGNKLVNAAIGVLVLAVLAGVIFNGSLVPGVKDALIWLTVFAHVVIIGLAAVMIFKPELLDYVKESATELAFIVAFTATTGSLFYSEIAGYTPCTLCWYQRIFMYPLVLLLGIAVYKKEDIKEYVLALTIPGAVIAVYHYFIQVAKTASTGCAAGGADCAVPWIFHLNYITIPMMAFTAFLLITLLMWFKREPKP